MPHSFQNLKIEDNIRGVEVGIRPVLTTWLGLAPAANSILAFSNLPWEAESHNSFPSSDRSWFSGISFLGETCVCFCFQLSVDCFPNCFHLQLQLQLYESLITQSFNNSCIHGISQPNWKFNHWGSCNYLVVVFTRPCKGKLSKLLMTFPS